jgi:hypothetical protein
VLRADIQPVQIAAIIAAVFAAIAFRGTQPASCS